MFSFSFYIVQVPYNDPYDLTSTTALRAAIDLEISACFWIGCVESPLRMNQLLPIQGFLVCFFASTRLCNQFSVALALFEPRNNLLLLLQQYLTCQPYCWFVQVSNPWTLRRWRHLRRVMICPKEGRAWEFLQEKKCISHLIQRKTAAILRLCTSQHSCGHEQVWKSTREIISELNRRTDSNSRL